MKPLFLLICLMAFPSYGVWFEASGQALIINGDKQHARKMATQEAIKQALMFAGAKVSSVQQLADGLLRDDLLEVRAGGEVDRVELIDEHIGSDIVTVSIRADIFPQESMCDGSDYRKSLVTAWFPIRYKQQASLGQIYDLGKSVPIQLKEFFKLTSRNADIDSVQHFYLTPDKDLSQQAIMLARKAGGQFVLVADIVDLSSEQLDGNILTFWRQAPIKRTFAIEFHLVNGITGEVLLSEQISTLAEWTFEPHATIDANSSIFWDSNYGRAIQALLQDVAQRIDEQVACQPAHGRVLQSSNEKLAVNLGKTHGVNIGDRMRLFKLKQFFDPMGNLHYQYQLHPEEVQVIQLSLNSSVVETVSGAPLSNIQPNDFVSKR
ncbi:flagellar assembly protein T N-terminal domain-containing protein [Aliiglaciecola sp. CAU 1673]|uniref:flagellar assembly protein T N-terminal domain-containing protein n=1 Tax=Aliiglaciecola sp. CAU 1673 TaxID=3032595 RepID=UPI0023DA0D64|nr:flagellar assembly protein T N-terminal domain-containing protein [Aliiglaciecola sp. CAU 1673]MDF2178335.1 flagellar assembly protein T N-terminal domain-containing protein [Aliiglaciecola sp. CAU 1673]